MNKKKAYSELEALARRGRRLAIRTAAQSGAGRVSGPFSAMDLLIALSFRVLKLGRRQLAWPGRDRFILSKGHSAKQPDRGAFKKLRIHPTTFYAVAQPL